MASKIKYNALVPSVLSIPSLPSYKAIKNALSNDRIMKACRMEEEKGEQ